VTLLRITTRCFAWRRASINSVDVHFSAVQLRIVRRSSRKILTYDSYSAAVFPWDRHVAKAKLSETRPRRVASPLFIVLLESVSIACNLDNAGDLSARGQELVQCAASYVISRILLVIPSHRGTTCFANNIDRRRPITSRTCHLIARHDTRSIKIKTPSPSRNVKVSVDRFPRSRWTLIFDAANEWRRVQALPLSSEIQVRWFRRYATFLCHFVARDILLILQAARSSFLPTGMQHIKY